jgi:hypothetical protein
VGGDAKEHAAGNLWIDERRAPLDYGSRGQFVSIDKVKAFVFGECLHDDAGLRVEAHQPVGGTALLGERGDNKAPIGLRPRRVKPFFAHSGDIFPRTKRSPTVHMHERASSERSRRSCRDEIHPVFSHSDHVVVDRSHMGIGIGHEVGSVDVESHHVKPVAAAAAGKNQASVVEDIGRQV